MDQKNNNNSDTSSAEIERSQSTEKPNKESGGAAASTGSSSGASRSYECTFCKRGFTNAQALGGHMNIHRKDKAKAKATNPKTHHDFPLIQTFQSNETFNDLISPVFGGHDMKYHHLHFPPSDRGIQYHDHFPVWRPEDHMDGNLSLRIGLSCPPVQDHDHHVVEDQIDLELRLGQYP